MPVWHVQAMCCGLARIVSCHYVLTPHIQLPPHNTLHKTLPLTTAAARAHTASNHVAVVTSLPPAPDPGGSACSYWSGYGNSATTRAAQGRTLTSWSVAWATMSTPTRSLHATNSRWTTGPTSPLPTCPPSHVDQHACYLHSYWYGYGSSGSRQKDVP